MKGFLFWLFGLVALILSNPLFAALPAQVTPAMVSQAASKQIRSANAPKANTQTAPQVAAAGGAGSGYFEVVGGLGMSQLTVGKSMIGVTSTESDWLSQNQNNWQSPFSHLGIGYVYLLSDMQRRYTDKLIWMPAVEPMLSLYYFNLMTKGNVYRFGDRTLNTNRFTLPVKSTSLMLDIFVTLAAYKQFTVFALIGGGEAWSHLKYSDTPNANNPAARPALNLKSRSQTNAAYEWGAGVSYAYNSCLAFSLEYLYTHIGNIKTTRAGTLGGVPATQIKAAGFGVRTQTVLLDVHFSL